MNTNPCYPLPLTPPFTPRPTTELPLTNNLLPVFKWYHTHKLPATPINPTAATITLPSVDTPFPALPSIARLPNPTQTSLSIITPPAATLAVLREAKDLGIPAVWLQPGTFNDEVVGFLKEAGFQASVLGEGGAGHEGWCVLVDGEKALRQAGKL